MNVVPRPDSGPSTSYRLAMGWCLPRVRDLYAMPSWPSLGPDERSIIIAMVAIHSGRRTLLANDIAAAANLPLERCRNALWELFTRDIVVVEVGS